MLSECGIDTVNPAMTKWKRLYDALVVEQSRRQCGNHVVALICRAISQLRHADALEQFEAQRARINTVLDTCPGL